MKLAKLHNFFWLSYTSLFIAFSLPAFAFSGEEINQQKSLIQRSFNTKPNNFILQKTNSPPVENTGNEFIPESPEPLKDYLFNVGDMLQINLLSQDIDLSYNLSISPEGKIFVPKIGEFYVINLSPTQLKIKLKDKVAKKLKDFEVSVILTRVRSLKIFLTGYAVKPGTYTVTYGTRLLDLLRHSDGITENGSLRNIEITNVKNQKKKYDLYNFVYDGQLEENPRLNTGDKIYIPYIAKRVAVAGNAIHPGIYEFKEKETPLDIVKLSGGISNGAAINKITIWKNGMNRLSDSSQELDIKNINSLTKNYLDDGDIIYIPSLKQPQEDAQIHIYGQIARPGSLPFKEGMKLSDYLKLAGGTNTLADMEKVKITRIKNKNGKNEAMNLTVDANDILYNGNSNKDLLLEANDVIFIPEKFFNFRNFSDITGVILTTLGIVSLVLSFTRK